MNKKLIGLCAGVFAGMMTFSAMAEDKIKIGVIAPLTGASAAWGAAASEAPKILADIYNKDGGLEVAGKKYPIEVIAYDDQYQTSASVAAFNRLVQLDGAKFVMMLSSAATVALRDMVAENQVLGLSSAYANHAMDKDNPYLWRIYSTPAEFMPSMVKWLRENTPENLRRVAIVNPNDETGWAISKVGAQNFGENGYEVVSEELFERTQSDFQPLMTKILAQKPDIIELGVSPPASAALIVRQARELGYEGLFFMSGGSGPEQIISAAGKEAAEGLVSMLFADPANPGYVEVVKAYTERNGHAPNQIIVPFYDGIRVLLAAIQKAGTIDDTAAIAKVMKDVLPMQSIQGQELTLGGMNSIGVEQQVNTVNYITVVKDGVPEFRGTVKGE